ncbi:HD domain-containing protein [Actinoallomurus sp. NPDC050550]|uniref:HD domain-containing protein n=1 Tax=Actinoallomurus sp. NPDC050550 TaxID=3154937 RepID=UPI0033E407D6
MAPVGTREWAIATRGALGFPDMIRLARDALLGQLAELLGSRTKAATVVVEREPPDSALARRVLALAEATYSAPLLGHCLRCWLWADLLAGLDGVGYDEELLYVSCLLHDLALMDPYRPGQAQCFAVHGGEVALAALVSHGAPESFAEAAAEAITLHMNIRMPAGSGPEARLLHDAAHLDVVGTRARRLSPDAIRAVLDRHPRSGFASAFVELMRREATERPRSRAGVLWRSGMRLPVSLNPLDRIR